MMDKVHARQGLEVLKILNIHKDDAQFIHDLHTFLYNYLEQNDMLEDSRAAHDEAERLLRIQINAMKGEEE